MVRNSGRRILSGIAGTALALLSQQSIAQGVFLDPILHEAVRVDLVSLGADPGVAIEADEMVGVSFTSFTNNSGLIFNLTGLEYATDLVDLDLASNRIYDVTPLASLKNLQALSLAMNGNTIEPEWLSDYTPLAKLINLTELDVAFNHVIEDLSFVQDLVNLTKLDASFNKIENLGPLLNLTNLTELYLGFNEIKNVSTLGALPNLNTVELVYNEITDITPLTENIGLTADDTIFLAHNPLSANALCIGLSALDARRVILDISSDCTAFTEQEYADVILGITIPDQPTLAAMDLNADYEVNVADLIRFLNGGELTTVPDVIGDTLAEAKEQIEDVSNLILGSKIASTPVVRIPAVQVLAQDSAGFAIPEKSEVNVTVSIPPDPFNFLTMGTGISDSKGRQQAEAYYLAIDPLNQKDTLPKWIAENGYGQPGGVEAEAVYFSSFDLGLGRHMYMRQDAGNTAYYVTNHDTVDDVWQSAANPLATVAMEYSPGPSGGEPYVKFYTFDQFGQRVVDVNLDGRGERYQPSMCMTCHGGQPKTLVNGIYPDEGNTGARFVPFDLEALSYSEKNARYTRAPQEDEFKKFNRAVVDHLVELQAGDGTIELIEGWYGGEGLPDDFNGDYVPSSWSDESTLYLDVIAQSCRSCHLQQTTWDFTTLSDFSTHNAKTIKHVFEQGVMPNALKTYQDFWLSTSPHRPALLAEFLGIS
ncbi:MAG: leucine-rich repeat domain-containing protein, partial [Candidatus Hydrogenedentota bacterium]